MQAVPDGNVLYNLYLDNALWYPGTGRTYSAYLGTMFRKDAVSEMPSAMGEAADVFTPDGQTIDGFAVELAGDIVSGYRPGILVDLPDVDTEGMTVAEAEAAGARPFSILYPAKNITNWEQSLIDGHLSTTRVVLQEQITLDKGKEKYQIEGKQLKDVNGYAVLRRELSLVSIEGMRVYQQALYAQTENSGTTRNNGAEWTLITTRVPMMNGKPLDYIPFIPVTTAGLIWALSYPLINDIAVLNMADYRNEALYRDALLFNGRPTPCVAGIIKDTPNQQSITLGSSSVLQFETDGKWGTLGGGADAQGLKDSGNDLKNRMALVGSRALAEDPRGVEAAETAAIHRQGEDGLLSAVATSVSMGMTRALEIMRDWWPADVTGDVSYTVNSDFIPGNVDAARLTAVWTMFQSGSISFDTFFSYLQRGEVYADGWSKEDEIEAIESASDEIPIGSDDLDDDTAIPSP
jgi:hypothetical protein